MRSIPFILLALVGSALGCGILRPESATIAANSCSRPDDGSPQFTIRRATSVDTLLAHLEQGSLSIEVRAMRRTRSSPLSGANVRLFASDSTRPENLIISTVADERGWVRRDSLVPGTVLLHARAIGYLHTGELVTVRAGYRDSIVIGLPRDINCLDWPGSA